MISVRFIAEEWRRFAACRGNYDFTDDPDICKDPDVAAKLINICGTCPVLERCVQRTLEEHSYGARITEQVRGGMAWSAAGERMRLDNCPYCRRLRWVNGRTKEGKRCPRCSPRAARPARSPA